MGYVDDVRAWKAQLDQLVAMFPTAPPAPPPSPPPTLAAWPRFGWSVGASWGSSFDQVTGNGASADSLKLVKNWLIFPTDLDTAGLGKIRAAIPDAQVLVYLFGFAAWQMAPWFGAIRNTDAWLLKRTDGRVWRGPDGQPVEHIGNPDCRAFIIRQFAQLVERYGLSGFEWDGPTQPKGFAPSGAQNSVDDLVAVGIDPAQLTTFQPDMEELWAGLLRAPYRADLPVAPLTESAGQDWVDRGLTLAADFYAPRSDVWIPSGPFDAARARWFQDAFDHQHAHGRGLGIGPASGTTDETWDKYFYCLHLVFSDGVHDVLGHEQGPWRFMVPSWGTNHLLPGQARGPAEISGNVWTRVFENAIALVDLGNPPTCRIG